MQPFGIPKNPKMTVQTRKQPPAQRYPNPYGVTSKPTSTGPTPQKTSIGPFAEDNTKIPFEISQHHRPSSGFDENEGPLQTPERLDSFGTINQGYGFEETPAGLIRGDSSKMNESNQEDLPPEDTNSLHGRHLGFALNDPQHLNNNTKAPSIGNLPKKLSSPDRKATRTRDDDEYVRMASADEEEDGPEQVEEPDFQQESRIQRIETKNRNQPVGKNEALRVYEEDQDKTNINFHKSPNVNEIVDTNIMLKVKRLELELAKEKQRADFLEDEQGKLIDDNAELRRRTEELNARLDLAKKYDSSDRLARKEEEVERLRLEVNRLSEESQMYENHARRVLEENSEYKRESEVLIVSLQEEKRRLQNEVQSLKRELENRVSSKVETVQEKNRILENQLTELRQQVQILTEQLLMKTNTQQKMVDVSGELQSLVSNLSTMQTRPHSAGLKSQHMQTSPNKFFSNYHQGAEMETQTHGITQESQQIQTLPVAFQNEPRDQISIESQTYIAEARSQHMQTSPSKSPFGHVQTQNAQTSPAKWINPAEMRSAEKFQSHPRPISKTSPFQVSPVRDLEQKHELEENPIALTTGAEEIFPYLRTEVSVETTVERHQEQLKETPHFAQELHNQEEEKPPMFKPPTFHPPGHHLEGPPITQQNKTQGENEVVSGSGLMAPPKYKIPQRHVPKKPVGGLKPLSQNPQLFSDDPQHKSIEDSFKVSTMENENQNIEKIENNPQLITEITEISTSHVQKEEPVHHINPTGIQEPVHSTIEQTPPKITYSEDHPPMGHVPIKENEPPKTTTPGQTFPLVNRPPLFNAHHAKPKPHKIGKNPFSDSSEDTSAVFNLGVGVPESKPEKISEQLPRQITPQTKLIPQRSPIQEPQTTFQQVEDQLSPEAAESFFDQLGKGTSQSTEVRGTNPFMNQPDASNTYNEDAQNWNQRQNTQQKSINEASGINVGGKGPEVSKSQVGKAIPIKKKMGALPTNMFD